MIHTVSMNFDKINISELVWNKYIKEIKENLKEVYIQNLSIGKLQAEWSSDLICEEELSLQLMELLSDISDKYGPIAVGGDMGLAKSHKEILDIDINPLSGTYLYYSTNLCIIQAEYLLKNWLMSNFINVKFFCNMKSPAETAGNNFIFLEMGESAFEEVMLNECNSYEDLKNVHSILEFAKKNIDNRYYINIHLDEYYLPSKDNYLKRHFVHENLIYGYDDEQNVVLAFGFSKAQALIPFKIKYSDFIYSYEKGKLFYKYGAPYLEDNPWAVEIRTVRRPVQKYLFDISILAAKLREYLYPCPSVKNGDRVTAYGINAYDLARYFLAQEYLEFNPVDIRVFQLLYEHKRNIFERIKYISDIYNLAERLESLLNKYNEIVKGLLSVRNYYMKQLIREGNAIDLVLKDIKNTQAKKTISEKIELLQNREKTILDDILGILDMCK